MGDLHGSHRALRQCLERSGFDKQQDTLIQLGDVVDRCGEEFECVEELLTIPNLVAIKGNHDDWLNDFIMTGYHPVQWNHGGDATVRSYLRSIGKEDKIFRSGQGYKTALNPSDIPESHQQFFSRQQLYHIDDLNNCYVHGGFNRQLKFKGQHPQVYFWDRDLWSAALSYNTFDKHRQGDEGFCMATPFNEIFLGHTPTLNWDTDQPMKAANIYNLDTGGGHAGRLTIMEVGSKQFWQSDPSKELYRKETRIKLLGKRRPK